MNTEDYLKKQGYKKGQTPPESDKRFKDGGQYRFEVPGIQKPDALKGLIESKEYYDVNIHRVTQTKGIMLLTDPEIVKMAEMAQSQDLELFLSVGPRASYDTSASAQTKEGARIGYRLRGYKNLLYAVEDVKRAVNLGVRGIVVYDEGLLWLLSKMREDEEIPSNTHFKVSAHTGHGNPASASLIQHIGANSFNPVRDLSTAMMSEIRQAIEIPLDIHTENPASSGGFIRHYEAPEIVKVASPVYLKTGGAVAKHHGWDTTISQAKERIRQVKLVKDMINRFYPDAKISKKGSKLATPEL
jgi:hypothetical protein